MGRPNDIPIVIPAVKKRGDTITADWANQLRDAVVRLKNRGTIDKSYPIMPGYVHPYKIFVNYTSGSYEMQMQIGRFTTMRLASVSGIAKLISTDQYISYDSSAGAFLGDDFDTNTPGGMYLSSSTTYGVWVTSGVAVTTGFGNPGDGQYDKIDDYKASGATVKISSTYTVYSDALNYAVSLISTGGEGVTVFYIGQIQTFSDGSSIIKQWRKSDICVGNMVLPTDLRIVSADSNNGITEGSDGGAFREGPTVSTDANNSITVGGDGGAFYDAP
jgi:hypothetical protein